MRFRVPPSALFATFVAVSVISGLGLAELEGVGDSYPVLGTVVRVSFFLMIPTLIAAAVSAWRDVSEPSTKNRALSLLNTLVSPTTLFAFGACSLILSLAFDGIARTKPLGVGGALVLILESSAIPSLVASFVWIAVIWFRQRRPSI